MKNLLLIACVAFSCSAAATSWGSTHTVGTTVGHSESVITSKGWEHSVQNANFSTSYQYDAKEGACKGCSASNLSDLTADVDVVKNSATLTETSYAGTAKADTSGTFCQVDMSLGAMKFGYGTENSKTVSSSEGDSVAKTTSWGDSTTTGVVHRGEAGGVLGDFTETSSYYNQTEKLTHSTNASESTSYTTSGYIR